jgi:hypothetical protein
MRKCQRHRQQEQQTAGCTVHHKGMHMHNTHMALLSGQQPPKDPVLLKQEQAHRRNAAVQTARQQSRAEPSNASL